MVAGQRMALERLWRDRCKIIVREPVTDPVKKTTDFTERVLVDNQPCKLSFGSLPTAEQGNVATAGQTIKVFMAPEISVPPGSKIVITRGDVSVDYAQSGQPAVFFSHQEISLELFRGWA